MRTLELYLANILQQKSENVNGSAVTLTHMMKRYGFDLLEEANERINAQISD